jgi:hypothetical protein
MFQYAVCPLLYWCMLPWKNGTEIWGDGAGRASSSKVLHLDSIADWIPCVFQIVDQRRRVCVTFICAVMQFSSVIFRCFLRNHAKCDRIVCMHMSCALLTGMFQFCLLLLFRRTF